MDAIYQRSRDNARTPVQWSGEAHAGFTTGTPWVEVNPNYRHINAEAVVHDPTSIFYYYKKLIQLRKQYEIIVYGEYKLLAEKDEQVFAYTRQWKDQTLLVITSFTEDQATFILPDHMSFSSLSLLISNYQVTETEKKQILLRPYEARVYLLG